MNAIAEGQLRILVEKAVRPVRAGMRRKQEVRDKLLASAEAIFKEELSRCHDEVAAFKQTETRFGDPKVRSLEIQKSVPLIERLASLMWLHFAIRRGETQWRLGLSHAYSVGVTLTVLIAGAWGLMGFSLFVKGVKPITFQEVISFLGAGAVLHSLLLLLVSVVILLGHAMWHALYRSAGRSWMPIILVAAASAFVVPAGALAICLLEAIDHGKDPLSSWPKMLPLLPAFATLGPFILIFVVNLIWRTLHGSRGRTWQQALLVDSAWCLAVSSLTFALALSISGDFWISLDNFRLFATATVCNLIPLDLIISAPSNITLIRSAREWDALPLE